MKLLDATPMQRFTLVRDNHHSFDPLNVDVEVAACTSLEALTAVARLFTSQGDNALFIRGLWDGARARVGVLR